jgi:hypothetical protein
MSVVSSSRSPCISDLRPLPAEACLETPSLLSEIPTVGVLVIASPERLTDLLHCISSSAESHAYIFIAAQAGVLPALALINDLPNSILLMQETSQNTIGLQEQIKTLPMWDEYLYQQRCNYSTCDNTEVDVAEYALIQDPSVTAMSQAVRLYAKALRNVHKLKCGGKRGRCARLNELTPEEWQGTLRSASERGVRFNMEQRSSYQLYFKPAFSYDVEKVYNQKIW